MASVLCVGPSWPVIASMGYIVRQGWWSLLVAVTCNRDFGSLHGPARQCLYTSCLLLSSLLVVNQGSRVFCLF